MAETQFIYEWHIEKLETTARVGSYDQVISRVYWTIIGTDDKNNRAQLYGNTIIDIEPFKHGTVEGFVSYDIITQSQVEELLENTLSEDEIARLTDDLKSILVEMEQTKVTTQVPPWVK